MAGADMIRSGQVSLDPGSVWIILEGASQHDISFVKLQRRVGEAEAEGGGDDIGDILLAGYDGKNLAHGVATHTHTSTVSIASQVSSPTFDERERVG